MSTGSEADKNAKLSAYFKNFVDEKATFICQTLGVSREELEKSYSIESGSRLRVLYDFMDQDFEMDGGAKVNFLDVSCCKTVGKGSGFYFATLFNLKLVGAMVDFTNTVMGLPGKWDTKMEGWQISSLLKFLNGVRGDAIEFGRTDVEDLPEFYGEGKLFSNEVIKTLSGNTNITFVDGWELLLSHYLLLLVEFPSP
jgi:hypothetical protein